MANWAFTTYNIEGSKSDLKAIENTINEFMNGTRTPEPESSKEWEGNVIKALGGEILEGEFMRGFFHLVCMYNDFLHIECEEAWGATDFRIALKRIFPDIKVYFVTEEQDGDVFATNDKKGKYFPERFYVDACVKDEYTHEYFQTEKDMFDYLKNKFGINSYEEAEDFSDEHYESDEYISLYKFEVVEQ